ncbi:MAG: ruvC [Clostridiaceae bacterium]|jgi:crossover junction endodeoxyribonuclease RuvC|nr:ruvC [Clostridiaceae bacterium]
MDVKVVISENSIVGVGIDQGIANCGYAIVELTVFDEINILSYGTLKTKSSDDLSTRLRLIYDTINNISNEYNVNIYGCERLFFSPKQNGRNKSASIINTNMATGVIYLIAGQKNVHIKDFVPGTVKKYVAGNGKATKEQVEEAVQKIIGDESIIKSEHEADAIAIAVTSVKYYKENKNEISEREINSKTKKNKKKKGE